VNEHTVLAFIADKLNELSTYALIEDDVVVKSPNLVKLYPDIINISLVKYK
jgi:hypothetical protein